MEEDTSARDLSSKTTASSHPCFYLELAIKKLLGCLGLDSIFNDPSKEEEEKKIAVRDLGSDSIFNDPSKEEEEKKTTEDITSMSRSMTPSLMANLASSKPKKQPIDPGRGGQTNSSNTSLMANLASSKPKKPPIDPGRGGQTNSINT